MKIKKKERRRTRRSCARVVAGDCLSPVRLSRRLHGLAHTRVDGATDGVLIGRVSRPVSREPEVGFAFEREPLCSAVQVSAPTAGDGCSRLVEEDCFLLVDVYHEIVSVVVLARLRYAKLVQCPWCPLHVRLLSIFGSGTTNLAYYIIL